MPITRWLCGKSYQFSSSSRAARARRRSHGRRDTAAAPCGGTSASPASRAGRRRVSRRRRPWPSSLDAAWIRRVIATPADIEALLQLHVDQIRAWDASADEEAWAAPHEGAPAADADRRHRPVQLTPSLRGEPPTPLRPSHPTPEISNERSEIVRYDRPQAPQAIRAPPDRCRRCGPIWR